MNVDEAAKILGDRYRGAAENEKVVSIHLFGIEFANAIEGMSLVDVAVRAGLPKSYGTELRKGINLARFVALRKSQG